MQGRQIDPALHPGGLTVQPPRRRGLFAKYALWSATLVSTLLAASGAVSGYFAWREAAATQGAMLAGQAEAVAIRIDGYLRGLEQPLAWAAQRAADDTALARVELVRLLRDVAALSELRWLDNRGREHLLVSRLALDEIGSGRDFSGDGRFSHARASGRHVGQVYFHKGSEPYLSLAVATSQGEVLIAEVNLKFVWDVVAREHIGAAGVAYVVDARGRLISHPDISRVLRLSDLSDLSQVRAARMDATAATVRAATFGRDDQGASVLAAAAPVGAWGWTVIAELPAREALAPAYRSAGRAALLVLLGIVSSIAASVVFARRLVQPIRALERGAQRIGAGDLEQRIELRSGDELEALAGQFNRMAADLGATYATLEARIADRTQQLAQANEAKTRFLAAASHDLRQPMHALALFVGQLRHAVAEDRPVLATLVPRIEASVDALRELLDALLDLSKLDAGALAPERESFALGPLLERVARQFAPAADAKGLALRVARTSVAVESDPRLLERIVLNLVANAVRYTPRGGLLLGCRRRGAGEVDIVVADTGIGIATEDLPRVFQEFYQVDSRDRGQGLGLGLAIVERLVRLLGHTLSVRSVPGRGSVFAVRVALASAVPSLRPAATAPASPGMELAGCRVLVVDDDSASRDAMRGLLERWGCSVTTAADRAAAIAAAAAAAPDAVICDLRLRADDCGLGVIAALEERYGQARARILVTGDMASEATREAGLRGVAVLHKPTPPAKLRALLEQQLAKPTS